MRQKPCVKWTSQAVCSKGRWGSGTKGHYGFSIPQFPLQRPRFLLSCFAKVPLGEAQQRPIVAPGLSAHTSSFGTNYGGIKSFLEPFCRASVCCMLEGQPRVFPEAILKFLVEFTRPAHGGRLGAHIALKAGCPFPISHRQTFGRNAPKTKKAHVWGHSCCFLYLPRTSRPRNRTSSRGVSTADHCLIYHHVHGYERLGKRDHRITEICSGPAPLYPSPHYTASLFDFQWRTEKRSTPALP